LVSTTTTKDPIGPKLVKERSTNKEDIGARITRLRPIVAAVKTVLTEGCHRRGLKFEERAASAIATTAAAATTATATIVTPFKRSRASSNFTTPSAKKPRAGTFAPMKKRSRKRCCVRGCAGVDQLTCVQPMPGPLPGNASVKVQTSYNKRLWKRRETLRRLGLSPDDETKDLRFCKSHPWEEKSWSIDAAKVVQEDGSVNKINQTIKLKVPVPLGPKSFQQAPKVTSKGNGNTRAVTRILQSVDNTSDAAALQQVLEHHDVAMGRTQWSQYHPSIIASIGLDVHIDENTRNNRVEELPVKRKAPKVFKNRIERTPHIFLKDLTPKEVHRRTAFCDLKRLLSYVAVICNGDLKSLTTTTTALTWLEEWVLYMEITYGRTHTRWEDYEKDWKLGKKRLKGILRLKLDVELETRRRWPMYASVAEDLKFRNQETWPEHFPQKNRSRIYMHDNTNVPLLSPQDPDLQAALYSEYYAETCAKGGVAVQQCGYIRTLPLCTGAIGDQDYLSKTETFEKQKQFTEADSTSDEPALNVLDKGYRSCLAAQKEGQQCMQPNFAQSDMRFNSNQTLNSAAVAVVRSGNERAVSCKTFLVR